METVKACTTVGGHSPVHTSPWLPSGLTCVWALSIPHSLNWTPLDTHTRAHKQICLSCKCRQVCRLSQQDFNTSPSRTHAHAYTNSHTCIHAAGCHLGSRFDRHIRWVTCGAGASCCWGCKNLICSHIISSLSLTERLLCLDYPSNSCVHTVFTDFAISMHSLMYPQYYVTVKIMNEQTLLLWCKWD